MGYATKTLFLTKQSLRISEPFTHLTPQLSPKKKKTFATLRLGGAGSKRNLYTLSNTLSCYRMCIAEFQNNATWLSIFCQELPEQFNFCKPQINFHPSGAKNSKPRFLKAQILQDKETHSAGSLWKMKQNTKWKRKPSNKKHYLPRLMGFRPIVQARGSVILKCLGIFQHTSVPRSSRGKSATEGWRIRPRESEFPDQSEKKMVV